MDFNFIFIFKIHFKVCNYLVILLSYQIIVLFLVVSLANFLGVSRCTIITHSDNDNFSSYFLQNLEALWLGRWCAVVFHSSLYASNSVTNLRFLHNFIYFFP